MLLDIYWQWPVFRNCDRPEFFSGIPRSSRGQSHISPLLFVQREFATDAREEARSVDINRGWGPVADARHRAYSRGYKNIAFISHRGVSSSHRDFFSSSYPSSLSLPFAARMTRSFAKYPRYPHYVCTIPISICHESATSDIKIAYLFINFSKVCRNIFILN